MNIINKILLESEDDFFKPRKVDERIKQDEDRKKKFEVALQDILNSEEYIKTSLGAESITPSNINYSKEYKLYSRNINFASINIHFTLNINPESESFTQLTYSAFNPYNGYIDSNGTSISSKKELIDAIKDFIAAPQIKYYIKYPKVAGVVSSVLRFSEHIDSDITKTLKNMYANYLQVYKVAKPEKLKSLVWDKNKHNIIDLLEEVRLGKKASFLNFEELKKKYQGYWFKKTKVDLSTEDECRQFMIDNQENFDKTVYGEYGDTIKYDTMEEYLADHEGEHMFDSFRYELKTGEHGGSIFFDAGVISIRIEFLDLAVVAFITYSYKRTNLIEVKRYARLLESEGITKIKISDPGKDIEEYYKKYGDGNQEDY